ncbi:hypothetical protein BY996DRAFT_4613318 [Phakopsora pachyrhizi]|nr:hypothetical protein BY996DRAFT_4613318 [Phakopsora pachyrhizi]
MIPPSILLSSDPTIALRIFNSTSTRPTDKSTKPQNHNNDSALQPVGTDQTNNFQPNQLGRNTSYPSKRLRRTKPQNHNNESAPLSYSSISSLSNNYRSSSSNTTVTTSSDEDEQDEDSFLVPAYPSLPPTPLTPDEILKSKTLSKVFSTSNRSFYQISDSATGLIEADNGTCNKLTELVELLRGDITSQSWIDVMENILARDHQEDNVGRLSGNGQRLIRTSTKGGNVNRDQSNNQHQLHQQCSSKSSSILTSDLSSSSNGSADSNLNLGHGHQRDLLKADDGSNGYDVSNEAIPKEYRIAAQAPRIVQSLFISSSTIPFQKDNHQLQANHTEKHPRHRQDQSMAKRLREDNQEGTAEEDLESLTREEQLELFRDSVYELNRFLGDLVGYRDRLMEIRDGCLKIEKRRRAIWSIVKICAKGFEELSRNSGSHEEIDKK